MFEAKLKPENHVGQGKTSRAGAAKTSWSWSNTEVRQRLSTRQTEAGRLACGQQRCDDGG